GGGPAEPLIPAEVGAEVGESLARGGYAPSLFGAKALPFPRRPRAGRLSVPDQGPAAGFDPPAQDSGEASELRGIIDLVPLDQDTVALLESADLGRPRPEPRPLLERAGLGGELRQPVDGGRLPGLVLGEGREGRPLRRGIAGEDRQPRPQ